MSTLQAIILGLVQGITEFLPISSTAHLVLVPHLFGWPDPGLRFAIWTNAATLLAVVVFFRRDLMDLASDLRQGRGRLAALLLVATIPMTIFGLLAYEWLSTAARGPTLIALASIVFGVLLGWADRAGARVRPFERLGWRDAVLIGCAQALALIPGTSRSGATMTAGLALGFTRTAAARFSLLLAIPAGAMALGKELLDVLTQPGSVVEGASTDGFSLWVGVLVAGLSAYLVIGWLLRWLEKQSMQAFVVYRVALGLFLLGMTAL